MDNRQPQIRTKDEVYHRMLESRVTDLRDENKKLDLANRELGSEVMWLTAQLKKAEREIRAYRRKSASAGHYPITGEIILPGAVEEPVVVEAVKQRGK